jgi:hypothetical protein
MRAERRIFTQSAPGCQWVSGYFRLEIATGAECSPTMVGGNAVPEPVRMRKKGAGFIFAALENKPGNFFSP